MKEADCRAVPQLDAIGLKCTKGYRARIELNRADRTFRFISAEVKRLTVPLPSRHAERNEVRTLGVQICNEWHKTAREGAFV